IQSTVMDLPVNFGSERGLLGIALHPKFPTNPGVYLYWTESTTGNDTSVLSETPLLGNRVDRFTWDGSTLTLDRNIIRLHALQQDATNPVERGNHNGGIIRFGPMPSFIFLSAITVDVANCRTFPTDRLGLAYRTTSSAAPSQTMPILREWSYA